MHAEGNDFRADRAEDEAAARLVVRVQAGDEQAFAELYSLYFDRIYGYLRVVLRDADEAEDIAQRVFIQAMEGMPEYRPRRPIRAWLFTIARNRAVDHLRRVSRSEVTDPETLAREQDRSALRGSADEAQSAEWTLGWIGDTDLMTFIERIPLAQRQVLALRFLAGFDTEEICEILDRNPSDVRVLQSRALRFLRERLTAVGRAPRTRRRTGAARCGRQAVVLRRRRFAMLYR